MTPNKEAIAKAPSGRVRRSPLARKNVLTVVGKEDGFQYRIVNDTEDRVTGLIDQGYEVVSSTKVQIGDKRVSKATPEGSVVSMSVGGGKRGVLVRIPDEFYQEDQKIKQDYVAETERATKADALSGTYGKLEVTRN